MKIRSSILAASLLIGVGVVVAGCSSGSDSSSSDGSGLTSSATTSVSGTTGDTTSSNTTTSSFFTMAETTNDYGSATLIVDTNGDGLLGSTDTTYTVAVSSDGSFSFDDVVVDENNEVKAQLTVQRDGYAPIVKTLMLTKDTPLSIFAQIDKPVLTEVQKLPVDSATRANSFVQFGITQSSTGIKAFSKLMTLSELKAEADIGLGDDAISKSTIPVAAFASSVTSVTAKMQAFDSTKAGDIALFPGAFSGHGKPQIGTSATSDDTERPLESAAFDMIKLTDQNGDDIELQSVATSKLSAMDASSCNGMYWTRRVTSDQATVIEAWGDDDGDTSNGFQVPIWSNDNSTGTWEYVGQGDWNASTSTFAACVDKKWQGYLNCDSEISFSEPKQICINAVDQNGEPFSGGVSIQGRKGNSYTYEYLDSEGKGTLAVTTGTPSEWEYTYRGAITGWSNTAIDASSITTSSVSGCDYDMDITIDNPFSAKVYVYAFDDNDQAVSSAYVQLKSSSYSDYYNQSAYTNDKGYAIFDVKPNVAYTAKYKAGTSAVTVNGAIVSPETADSGVYASVEVKDTNIAPSAYIYTNRTTITDIAETLRFTVSANDANNDALTIQSIKLNGTTLSAGTDYIVLSQSSYNGYVYLNAKLDLNSSTMSGITPQSLAQGDYTLSAVISDGKLSSTSSRAFTVKANSAPTIGSIYLRDSNYSYYYENSSIPVGDYTIDAYVYDIDGDSVTKTVSVDGSQVSGVLTLAEGEHNISVHADDGSLSSTKTTTIYVGNHAPEITSSGATKYRVDINAGEKFKLYAYAADADYDALTLTATSANGTVYPMTKVSSYGTKYESAEITLTSVSAQNAFYIVANDTEANSTVSTVNVESFAANQAPIFTKALVSTTINKNTTTTFTCQAQDPEGTFVSYTWSLDGQTLSTTGESYTTSFSATGAKSLSCTATDSDGESSTSSATVLVVDPTQTSTLTVHTGLANTKVSIHNPLTAAIISSKSADSNGDASFSVTGDRVSFSITTWPGMVMDPKTLMKLVKQEFLNNAYNLCSSGEVAPSADVLPTQCTTADWCTLNDANTIPNWVWDVVITYDDNTPASSAVDTNSDGYISESELYTAVVTLVDVDQSGDISFAEFNGMDSSINVELLVNVPVREYYIMPEGDYDEEYYYFMQQCTTSEYFESSVTLHSFDTTTYLTGSVSGSGYGSLYGYPDQNADLNTTVYVYNQDSDGKYSFLFEGGPNDNSGDQFYYFLPGKTKAELDAGITLNLNDFVPADKNVTVVNDSGNEAWFYVNGVYKGVYLSNASSYYVDPTTTRLALYTNPAFNYVLQGSEYTQNMYASIYKSHYGYYGNGTLKDRYNMKDYPMLDINPAFDQNGKWSVSGSDLGNINSTSFEIYASGYDQNSSTYFDLSVNVHWTIAPTQMPDLNVSDLVSSDLKDTVDNMMSSADYVEEYLWFEELKGLNETQFLDLMVGANSSINDEYDYEQNGVRYVDANFYPMTVYGAMSSSNKEMKTAKKIKKPFAMSYDASKLFGK